MFHKQSEQQLEQGRKAFSRLVGIYKAIFAPLPLLAVACLFFAIGYAKGYFDGWTRQPTIWEHVREDNKESSNDHIRK